MQNSELPFSSSSTDESPALADVVIPLLKGILYRDVDPVRWEHLLSLESQVRDYVAVLQLRLTIDLAEGHAFLQSEEPAEDVPSLSSRTPRLFLRHPLSYPVSLILALLRKKLAEFDASGSESRLILTRENIVETVRLFLLDHANEARVTDQIERHLNRIVELGFLRKLTTRNTSKGPVEYEVRRILKTFVDAQWLADFDARLAEYRKHLEELNTDLNTEPSEKDQPTES